MRPALLLYLLHMKVSYCPCFDVCCMPFFLMWGGKKSYLSTTEPRSRTYLALRERNTLDKNVLIVLLHYNVAFKNHF